MAFSSKVLTIEKKGSVGTLWLDRPEKRNALSTELWEALPDALDELARDEDVRAIVLAGRGKSFCVGLDLSEFGGGSSSGAAPASQAIANLRQLDFTTRFQEAITAISKCPLPVIAVVHGHCLGGGIDIITACDVRVAAADANFSIRETRIGIVADVGTLQRLPKILNAGHVAELAYTGKDIGAERAEKIGLVNDIYESFDAAYSAAHDLANDIAANSPLAVRGTKFILHHGENLTTEQSLLLNGMYTMVTSLHSNDLKEAMEAFMEKRPANFTGT
jgi:enoyl-CoA hydratase/carnithine racemase